jgi:hypothetical protein
VKAKVSPLPAILASCSVLFGWWYRGHPWPPPPWSGCGESQGFTAAGDPRILLGVVWMVVSGQSMASATLVRLHHRKPPANAGGQALLGVVVEASGRCPCHLAGRSLRPSWPSLTRRKLHFAIPATLSFQHRSIGMGNAPHPFCQKEHQSVRWSDRLSNSKTH